MSAALALLLALPLLQEDDRQLHRQGMESAARGDPASLRAAWRAARALRSRESPLAAEVEAKLWHAAAVWPLACEALAERRRSDPDFSIQGFPFRADNFLRGEPMTDAGMAHVEYTPKAPVDPSADCASFYVVFTREEEPPCVYAARRTGLWMKADLNDWIRVWVGNDQEFGAWGAVDFSRRMERVRQEWLELRSRLAAQMKRSDLPAALSTLRELAALSDVEPWHDALRQDFRKAAIRLLGSEADAEARRELAARCLRATSAENADVPTLRLRAYAALTLGNFPICLQSLERLPDDAETAALRARLEAAAPGRIVRSGELKKEWGTEAVVYRCEGRDGKPPAVEAYLILSNWAMTAPLLGIVFREGPQYRIDFQFERWRIRAGDLGETFPADKDLIDRIDEMVLANNEWNVGDCQWTSEAFFRHHSTWREVIDCTGREDYPGALRVLDALLEKEPRLYEALAHRLEISKKQADWTGALNAALRILEGSPERKSAWQAVSLAHEQLNDPAVLDDYTRLIALEPAAASRYLQRARYRREKLNDLKGALADMNLAVEKLTYLSEDFYKERAELRQALGQGAEALEDYTQALNKKPGWELYFARGHLRRRQGDAAGADEDYRRGCELSLDGWAYPYRARAREERGDLKGALEDYTRADRVTREPDPLAELGRSRAKLLEKLADLAAAAHELDRAAMIRPTYARCMEAADMWRRAGQEMNAADCERRALEAPTEGSQGLADRADARLRDEDWAGAIEDYGRSLEAAPNDAERSKRLIQRARAKSSGADPSGALADVDQALRLQDAWETRMLRAEILRDLGRDSEAQDEIRKACAMAIPPRETKNRAPLRADWGDFEGALADDASYLRIAGPYEREWVLLHSARCRLSLGKFEEACRDFYSSGASTDPDGLGWALELAGKPEEARREFEKYVGRANPGRWQIVGIVGALRDAGETDRAIAFLDRSMEGADSAEDRAALRESRSRLLAEKGDLPGAIAVADDLLAKTPSAEGYFRRADLRLLAGDEAGARADVESARSLDLRSDPARLEARARLRLSHGDPAGAAEDCAKAIAASRVPRRSGLLALRADCLMRAGDSAGAIAEWEQAIRLRPTWQAYLGRAGARRRAGDAAGAKADLQKALSMPCRAEELLDRAGKRSEAGDRAGREADYTRVIQIKQRLPASYWALTLRAFFRLEEGREAEALADMALALERARLEGRRAYAASLLNAAYLRWRAGRTDEAIRDVREGAALDRRPGALAMRGFLLRQSADLDHALRADSRDGWTLKMVARGRLLLGDARAAETTARRAIDVDGLDAEAWAVLAESLAAAGDREGARQALDRAASLDPDNRDLRKDLDRVGAAMGK